MTIDVPAPRPTQQLAQQAQPPSDPRPGFEPPHGPKPSLPDRICARGALEGPVAPKPRIAGEVWGLEVVCGRGDEEVARVAERQRGIVARSQLVAAGLSAAAIKHRLRVGQLHTLYPRVYLFGRPRLERLAAATAAIVHLGGRGVLSHRTAAAIWGLLDSPEVPVEVTTVGADVRTRRGLIVHRSLSLDTADVRLRDALPVTSPARTLLDLAGILDLQDLEAAYAVALRGKLVTVAEIRAAIARAPHQRGVANLRALCARGTQPTLTRSRYERKLLALIRRAEFPIPLANTTIEGHEVDLLWPDHKLVVEFDGFAYHSDRIAFERDRLRDQRLTAAGYRVLRVTARQLDDTPEAVIARLAAALAIR